LKHGAWNAVNLDGGGSTVLVVHDALANAPSEGRERPVANALLVFAPAAEGERSWQQAAPTLRGKAAAADGPLVVGARRTFTLSDGANRVLSTHPRVIWGTTGGVGWVDQTGVFVGLRPGTGRVQAALGANRFSFPVTVTAPPPVETSPGPLAVPE
jgi:hypothetical protein